MADKVKEILGKILEWWNRFTAKQKTAIVGISAVVVFSFAILIWVFSKPQYETLAVCESAKEASEITALLEGASIVSQVSDDGLNIKIKREQMGTARMLLGANGIPSDGYGIENVTEGGLSTTEADKQRKNVVFLQSQLSKDIESLDAVKSARVTLDIPKQDGTLLAKKEESFATVFLELEDEFTTEQASYLAKAIATALGNKTTNNVTILDMSGKLLFSGQDEDSTVGIAGSQLTVRQQAESRVINEVKKILLGTNQFNTIEVACNLDIDFSDYKATNHDFSAPDGREEGMIINEQHYSSESEGGVSGVPGTTSNEEETYQIKDHDYSTSATEEDDITRAPNESIEEKTTPAGQINFGNSSVSVTAISYKVIKEEDAKKQGLLDGISWDEYKAANSEQTKMEVDEEMSQVVSNATGINSDKITIVAYKENWFVDKEGLNVGTSDIVSVVLIILILGLLGFVVLHSMRNKQEGEAEEESLSVENLLQSMPEAELEDIEVEGKSEVRKMIEKFVDENPEAAANLLRNWLNEDWG